MLCQNAIYILEQLSLRAARHVTRFYLWYPCSCTASAKRLHNAHSAHSACRSDLEKGNVRASAHPRISSTDQPYPNPRPLRPILHTALVRFLLLRREATDGCQRRVGAQRTRATSPATSHLHPEDLEWRGRTACFSLQLAFDLQTINVRPLSRESGDFSAGKGEKAIADLQSANPLRHLDQS